SRGVKIAACATCHGVEADGRLSPPLANKDHMPCATSGCHQAEFASKTPRICGVCHDTIAPWQKNQARSKDPIKPEWYETIDHATHLAKIGTTNGACATCHGEKLANAPKPGGHDGCVGCHGQTAKPAMGDCGACHQQAAPQRPAKTPWSVTAQFQKIGGHGKHAIDRRTGKQAQCLDCHAGVKTATTLAQIKPATMMECDGACHNGKVAFKTTGFECARCHAAPATTAMVP
ncbi:MAG TPA: cytochrome c3 family protein, partial [Kofleriaceae bacterium]|nr:cytochrome c3 family protein [Kofleriaceae bacterium]